jgi:hypothetical protein
VKVRLPVEPEAIEPVSHEGALSTVTVWLAGPAFVHVMTSPTLAVTVAGANAKSATPAWTVPAAADLAQASPPAALGPAPLDPAGLELQAERATTAIDPMARRASLCMSLLQGDPR